MRRVTAVAWDAQARTQQMDREGVSVHVVSVTPFTFLYDTTVEICQATARTQNEFIAEMVSANPERFIGFGTVPLSNTEAAVAEVRYIDDSLGLHGVEIGTHLPDRDLDDPALRPFFAEVARRNLALFVHPWESRNPATTDRLGLQFAMGYPLATALAFGSLAFGGVLDEQPRLKCCFAHGAGALTAIHGRLSAGWERVPGAKGSLGRHPSEVFRRVWVDSLVYEPHLIPLLVDVFGSGHVVVGSDFPFVAGESPPSRAVDDALKMGLLEPGVAAQIKDNNARSFLQR